MHAAGGKGKALFNEINITPLTDIFLVLLIIMIVVAPMMQQVRNDIKPPELRAGSPVEQNKVTIEITKAGKLYVQGKEATEATLATVMGEQEALLVDKSAPKSAKTDKPMAADEKGLIIRADKATKSGEVLKVFEAARDAGFTKVTVAGEGLSEDRQSKLDEASANSASTGAAQ